MNRRVFTLLSLCVASASATPTEIARGKIAGASVIDFNAPKFEQRLSLIARDK